APPGGATAGRRRPPEGGGRGPSASMLSSGRMHADDPPLVSVIMGSKSDWETLRHAHEMLTRFDVPHECHIVSAHRTPEWMAELARGAEGRGIEVVIAGAGGGAPPPGLVAARTTL